MVFLLYQPKEKFLQVELMQVHIGFSKKLLIFINFKSMHVVNKNYKNKNVS